MLGRLAIIDSSRKSVGAENSAEAETYGHKKRTRLLWFFFCSEAEPSIFGLRFDVREFLYFGAVNYRSCLRLAM